MSTNEIPEAETVGGVPHRLLDGYDGGEAPPEEFIRKLLSEAPPEVRARAEAFAQQRRPAGEKGEGETRG